MTDELREDLENTRKFLFLTIVILLIWYSTFYNLGLGISYADIAGYDCSEMEHIFANCEATTNEAKLIVGITYALAAYFLLKSSIFQPYLGALIDFLNPILENDRELKLISLGILILILTSFSAISTEWARMTAELVDEEDDPHYGLPDIWEGEQVVCFHFPEGYAPTGFDDGRHHIDNDGTEFMTDDDWNETGACAGGFSGYNNGWNLLNAAVNASGNSLELDTTVFPFGLMVNSIGGVDPSLMTGDFGGAYWSLYHNGGLSMVGITDLELDSDSVITWRVDTW